MNIHDWQRAYRSRRKSQRAKLTEDDRRAILRRVRAGERTTDVARAFGVSPATVSRIATGQRRVVLDANAV